MKCTNCGFDADNQPNCPICGAPLPQPAPVQPAAPAEQNPYAQPAPVQPAAPAEQNPYAQPAPVQPAAPSEQNPYAQTRYDVPPADIGQNPYRQQSAAPQPQPPVPQQPAPQPPVAPPAAPVQPPVAPYTPYAEEQAPKKKKGNGGLLALGIVVGAVVLIGIIIAVFSVIFNNNTIIEEIAKRNAQSSSEIFYDDDDYLYDDEEDVSTQELIENAVPVGKAIEYPECTVTLESVTIEKESLKSNPDHCQYGFTVTVKNTTDTSRSYYMELIEILTPDGEWNEDFEYQYMDGNPELVIGAGESESICFVYEGPKDYGTVFLEMSDIDENDLFCFSADLSEAEKSK